jgi:glucose-6-phosphate 1-epimerase
MSRSEDMPMSAAELASRFRIGGVDFAETEHGLVKAMVSRGGMTGELFLQGAQITAWRPAGARPVIFLSSHANLASGKAIRGGIPIVFPWFGPHPTDPKAPQHGFARTADWQLSHVESSPLPGPHPLAGEGGGDRQHPGRAPSPASGGGSGWGLAGGITLELSLVTEGSALTCRVTFGAELRLSLKVRNTSNATAAFEQALHSYFAVSDVEHVSVSGLEASAFIDKTANMRRRPPAGAPLTLTRETDSVYLDAPDSLAIDDPGWRRRLSIEKSGAASAIVWNPWPQKAAAMADLGADNWRGMLCVETGNVADNRITLPPGGAHEMTTRIAIDAG